jgi:hypothetical protein
MGPLTSLRYLTFIRLASAADPSCRPNYPSSLKQKRHSKLARQKAPNVWHRQPASYPGEHSVPVRDIERHRPFAIAEHGARQALMLAGAEIAHIVVIERPPCDDRVTPPKSRMHRVRSPCQRPQREPPSGAVRVEVIRERHQDVRLVRQVPFAGKEVHCDVVWSQNPSNFRQICRSAGSADHWPSCQA